MTQADVDALQVQAGQVLYELGRLLPALSRLRETPTRATVLAPEAVAAAGRGYQVYRRQRAAAASAGYAEPPGPSPAPAGSAALLLIDIQVTLTSWIRRITRTHLQAGWCLWPPVGAAATATQCVDVLRDLTYLRPELVTRTDWLLQIARDVEHLLEQTRRLVDVDTRVPHPDPCPWCGRRSLVHHVEDDLIVCERTLNPRTGRRPVCECTRPVCPCHAPGVFEHSWSSQASRFDESWEGLANLVQSRRAAHDQELAR